jgi:protein-tyrosine-phosphatase
MAEAILKAKLRERLGSERAEREFRVSSFGLRAQTGDPISMGARLALETAGIHRTEPGGSRSAEQVLLSEIDLFCVMSESHKDSLLPYLRSSDGPIHVLKLGEGVADPFGGDRQTYLSCFRELNELIEDLLARDFLF